MNLTNQWGRARAEPARPRGRSSRALRNLRNRVAVDLDLASHTLVGVALDVPEPVDDHRRVGSVADELLVLAERVDLLAAALYRDVAIQIAVRRQQDDVERLDPTFLLHAPE